MYSEHRRGSCAYKYCIPSHSLAVDTLIVFLFWTAGGRVEPVTGVGQTVDSSAAN